MNNIKINSTKRKVILICKQRQMAFTLIELVVTMIISGLIVLAAVQVILSFNSITTKTVHNNEKYTDKLQFYKAIYNDMQKAVKLVHYDDETIFHFSDGNSVSYVWDFDYLVRSANETSDTFFIKMNSWHLAKEKSTNLPYILELMMENEDQEEELFRMVKEYDNEVMFNNSELKSN